MRFSLICAVHSALALTCGGLMMFYRDEISVFSHGEDIATKLVGSTPHDQLLIRTSDSFSGLLLFSIGIVLFMVAFVKDRDFHSLFAGGCTVLHFAMAIWRIYFERKVEEDLGHDWVRLVAGDIVMGVSWVLFLLYSHDDSLNEAATQNSKVAKYL